MRMPRNELTETDCDRWTAGVAADWRRRIQIHQNGFTENGAQPR
jgi:hypothetical protein